MVGLLNRSITGRAPAAIVGGFARVPVGALARAWRACRSRPLGVGDFRAWFALREMAARRCSIAQGRAPALGTPELARLLGVSTRRAAASARRLERAGLVAWDGGSVAFPGDDAPGDDALADSIGGGRGHLAVPRRILRHLAGGGRPALIATALGVLLRCLSRRKQGFDGRGRVKASWIAKAFGVDLRAVKAARKELVALGWIAPEPSDQNSENRWGRAYRVDLAWAPPRTPAGPGPDVADRHPPPAPGCRTSPPPLPDRDPLREQERNQEPASGGRAGVGMRGMEGRGQEPSPAGGGPTPTGPEGDDGWGPSASPPPRLAEVRPEDLGDAGRLLELHRQAAARGLVGTSEADRLKFVAAAEHARAVGRRNPCGLFARIVAKGWWDFATQGEEVRAARRLRAHERGSSGPAAMPGSLAVAARAAATGRRPGPPAVPPGVGAGGPVRCGPAMARRPAGGPEGGGPEALSGVLARLAWLAGLPGVGP